MKPGDLIEWYYKNDNERVFDNHCIWSSTMRQHVPVGETSLLLHMSNQTYSWKNSKGYFHAHIDDLWTSPEAKWMMPCFPRLCKGK